MHTRRRIWHTAFLADIHPPLRLLATDFSTWLAIFSYHRVTTSSTTSPISPNSGATAGSHHHVLQTQFHICRRISSTASLTINAATAFLPRIWLMIPQRCLRLGRLASALAHSTQLKIVGATTFANLNTYTETRRLERATLYILNTLTSYAKFT